MNSLGVIDRKWSIPTNISEKGRFIPEEICFSIRKTLGEDSLKIVTGIGIGVPGPISPDGKTVVQAVNLDWKDLPLREMLENDLGIGVCLLNDANAAALGEMWQGAAKGKQDLLFVTLGTGVGGGIVINGQVLNGCHSAGGEIGHIPVRSDEDRLCGCGGRNCLETFASANGLALSMRKKLETVGEQWSEMTPPIVFEKAAQNNEYAIQVLDEFTDVLGQALAGIMNTIDVEEVVIGGGLSEAGDALLIPLKKKWTSAFFRKSKIIFPLKKLL